MLKNYISARYLFAAGFLFLYICISCTRAEPEITVEELRQHIEYLASEELSGRYPGSEGDRLAAEYIRNQFIRSGLTPGADDGYQYFTVTTGVTAGEGNRLDIDGYEALHGTEFTPMSFSANAAVSAEVVFCGYGFSAGNGGMSWDDYEEVDTDGRWVMVLRGDPEPDDPNSIFATRGNDRFKAYQAAENGAAGIILVSGIKYSADDVLDNSVAHQGSVSIPVIQVTRHAADMILSLSPATVEELEGKLLENMQPFSFNTGTTVTASTNLLVDDATTMNVIASLEGSDPLLKNEYIVIGAHYDHLGTGGEGSGSRSPGAEKVHPGADDNASGVAAMIEIAEKLASGQRPRRSYIFIAFGAEEKGLIGSSRFMEDPVVGKEQITAMINLDMVGRKNEEKVLQIGGVGSSAGGEDIVNSISGRYGFSTRLMYEGYGPSDHASFYAKDIPVFFITTGAHPEYHTPDDRADLINYGGLEQVALFVHDLAEELGNRDRKLTFTEAGPRVPSAPRHGNRQVSLGIMPDFASVVSGGLRADIVSPGRPADLAGMKNGDIIVAINGQPVGDIHEYMYRLSQLSRGDIINVEVERGDTREILIIHL